MSEVFEVDAARPEDAAVAIGAAARAVEAGELVVFATETVYAIASRPDDPAATARVFEAKRRPPRLALPVLVATVNDAWGVGQKTQLAEALARLLWPGPLTLVMSRTARSRPWSLGEQRDTVAVRVPDHPLSHALLTAAGPLAASSANISGDAPLTDAEQLVDTFGGQVAVYLVPPARESLASGTPSAVVDVTGERPRLLRGGLDADRIEAALAGTEANGLPVD